MTDNDYLAELRQNMADPAEAKLVVCGGCGRGFTFRNWPAEDGGVLNAFLDGLAVLAERTGVTVYGTWMLGCPDEEPPEMAVATGPWQLWRANDRTLITEGDPHAVTIAMADHLCPARN